jgi:DNA-3-methyladenine glycosylase
MSTGSWQNSSATSPSDCVNQRPRNSHRASGPEGAYVRLPRSFYIRPTLTVARDLPGKYMLRRLGTTLFVGRIVEVEAYLGERDPASHAYRGKTPRNEAMFGEGGHLYVYFTYGMHFCANVVTEREGRGRAVLLRALEPLEAIESMTARRSDPDGRRRSIAELCSGPAKLCQAFGIGRKENETDLCAETIWLAGKPGAGAREKIARSTRIGISSGKEHLWRFYLKDNPFVSRGGKRQAGE